MRDAAVGRFTTEDPLGFAAGDVNLYRYVKNSPTNRTDPSGLQPPRPNGPQYPSHGPHQTSNNSIGNTAFLPANKKSTLAGMIRDGAVTVDAAGNITPSPHLHPGEIDDLRKTLFPPQPPRVVIPPPAPQQEEVISKPPAREERDTDSKRLCDPVTITLDDVLDGIQITLTVVGMIPVAGEPADLLDGIISLLRGDETGAMLSMASLIPFWGMPIGWTKLLRRLRLDELKTYAKEAEEELARRIAKGDAKGAQIAQEKLNDINAEIARKEAARDAKKAERPDCSVYAKRLSAKIGGKSMHLKPKRKGGGTGILPGDPEKRLDWQYHTVVEKDGKLYDEFHPDGINAEEWWAEYRRLNNRSVDDVSKTIDFDDVPHPGMPRAGH